MKWRRAGKRDLSQLLDFLLPHEWRGVPYTSRLRRLGKAVLPTALEASVLVYKDGSKIQGTMMLTSAGLLLPIFTPARGRSPTLPPGPFPGWKDLAFRLYSAMGPIDEVGWLEAVLPLRAGVSIDYHLMILNRDSFSNARRESFPNPPGLVIRTAYPRDLGALLPLQVRYELEEVVITRERYNEQACRHNLKRSLRQQFVLMAELNGEVVAKAGTNARGFTVDQIGGVFTEEEVRNSGIAFRVIEELLRRIFAEKSTVCLFVKKNNLPALALYGKLGFRVADGYRISYFKV